MKTKLFALAFAVACACLPAAAQADENRAFNGPHIAALVGWDDFSFDNGDVNFDFDRHLSDVTYGLQAGWDYRLDGNIVIGIGTGILFSDNQDTFSNGFDFLTVKANEDWEIGGRIGYVIAERAMVYLKAAYNHARFKAILTTDDITTEASNSQDGYRIGVGAEIMVIGPMFAMLEYRYSDYGHSLDRNQIVGGVGVRF